MIPTPYYRVGTGVYFNKFHAYYQAQITNQPLEFDLFDQAFDNTDWSEPAETWDQLLDLRAQQIASKNKPIILSFSGGTDSYTMYQVFRRNKIPLRALHIKLKLDKASEPDLSGVLEFFRQGLDDPQCEILISYDDDKLLKSWYDSPEWLINRGGRYHFSIFGEGQPFEDNHWIDNSLGDDYIQVAGMEKPRIEFTDTGIFSYQEDMPYISRLGDPRYVYFYITPDMPQLHVKQSYMLARYILDLAKKYNQIPKNLEKIETLQRINYLNYAIKGCGRFGDLANSHHQKILNRGCTLIIPNGDISQARYTGRGQFMLEEGIRNGSEFALNYLRGFLHIKSDPVLASIFRDSNNLYSLQDIRSKSYQLDAAAFEIYTRVTTS